MATWSRRTPRLNEHFSIPRPKQTVDGVETPLRCPSSAGGHDRTRCLWSRPDRLISEQLPPSCRGDWPIPLGIRSSWQPITFELDGTPAVYRPTATMLSRSDDGTRMQVVLEDVTAETRRHDLMEAYAARVVSGQEEERRHIAQEIHDGPVQSLIHLCRQIDMVSSAPD